MSKGVSEMPFDTMKKGYNRYQVDMAITNLEAEIETLKKRIEAYELQSQEDKAKLQTANTRLHEMSHDIKVKEEAAAKLTQIALKEANEILQSANMNADLIIKEAYYSAKDILLSISKLGVEAKGIKETLNSQLDALSATIEQFDVPPIPSSDLLNKCDD